MTAPPVASVAGGEPRADAAAGARRDAPDAHWHAAMDHAARGGDAPAPRAAMEGREPPRGHAGKNHGDDGGHPKRPGASFPHDAASKPGGHSEARERIAAQAGLARHAAGPVCVVSLILAAGQAYEARPSAAAAPAVRQADHAVARPDGKTEEGSHPAAKPEIASPAFSGSQPAQHAADVSKTDQTATPPHAGPETAAAPAAASAWPVPAAPLPAAAVRQESSPAPAPPARSAAAISTSPAHAQSGASASSEARAKPAAGDRTFASRLSAATPPQQADTPQTPAAALGAPAAGMPPVPPAQALLETGPSAGPTSGGGAVAATPSALAAAVVAMQKAGDHSTILSLDPAGLGAMTVHVSMAQGAQLNVQFVPSLPQTAHLLTAHLDDLRQAMTAAGIALGQASVSSDGGQAGGQGGGQAGQTRQPATREAIPAAQDLAGAGGAENRRGGLSAYA